MDKEIQSVENIAERGSGFQRAEDADYGDFYSRCFFC
jgi:hypothetical protein